MLLHYLKITVRNILKHKFRYLLTTLGIAVGITVFAIFQFAIDILNEFEHNLPKDKQLYTLSVNFKEQGSNSEASYLLTPYLVLERLKEEHLSEIQTIASYENVELDVYACPEHKQEWMFSGANRFASKEFFDLIGAKFISGGVSRWEHQPSVVLTDYFAKKLFGTTNVVGNSIEIHNSVYQRTFTIAGVIKPLNLPRYNAEIFSSESLFERKEGGVLVTLSKDASVEELNKVLKHRTSNYQFLERENVEYSYVELQEAEIGKNLPTPLYVVLSFLASIVLIIALFNFFNLLVNSIQARIRQFTLRRIVGANRWTFMLMLFCEIIPILLGATLISYLLTEIFIHWLLSSQIILKNEYNKVASILPILYDYPWQIALYTFLLCIVVAFLLTNYIQKIVLTQGIRGKLLKGSKNYMRNGLIFFQLLFTLIVFTVFYTLFGFLFSQIKDTHETLSKEQTQSVFSVSLSELKLITNQEEIISRIRGIAGVEGILSITGENNFSFPGFINYDKNMGVEAFVFILSEDYSQFMEMKEPLPRKSLAPNEAIVNQKLADKLNSLGKSEISIYGVTHKVVGSVSNIPYSKTDSYAVLASADVLGRGNYLVKSNVAQAENVKTEILKIIREYLPATIPYRMGTMYEQINYTNTIANRIVGGISILAVMSLILTLLGIYTAVNADITRRRKEIAIRKINGATYRDILWKHLRLYIIMLLIILILSIPVNIFALSGLELTVFFDNFSLMVIISCLSTWSVLVIFILLTIYRLIHKACSENPINVIKSE
ncbi:FtsX-like permease family protein [Capnocytophaga stomatis]|uniref:FtsX-like permease family protein n=1 Tax=Capnocytophaga stomatis TaxID=1848904 RepID=A0ABW8Q8P6_9FLAO